MFLEVEHVSIRYPRTTAPAVDSVSVQLLPGQLGVLLGPSGSGKTSLLRAVAGLEPAQSGSIRLDGKLLEGDGVRVPAEQRQIGMVFQDFALFPHLNVADNIGFGLRDIKRAERARIVEEMLALVGLPGVRSAFPHQLSGGQQQRIALARALAPQPCLLLLDEPFSSLDVELRERLAQDVRDILKRTGTTALMVTHDQMEAFAIADVAGVMRQGRLEQWDTPHALYHRPATRFTADFIGHGVLLPGRMFTSATGREGTAEGTAEENAEGNKKIRESTAQGEVLTALGLLRVTSDALANSATENGSPGNGAPANAAPENMPAAATQVDVLLRADDIIHDDTAPLKAKLVRKSFRGASFLYTLELADGQQVLSLAPSHHDHAIGETIGIRLDVQDVIAFPATSTEATTGTTADNTANAGTSAINPADDEIANPA